MKPGTRADREEMVRILVEDLKASVKVLDMHDYRKESGSSLYLERGRNVRTVNRLGTTY